MSVDGRRPDGRRFAGLTALVTGGAHGIGAATCRRLAAEGAEVVVADLDLPAAEELAAEFGDRGRAVRLDAGDPVSWDALAESVHSADGPGGVDVVVNNAFSLVVRPAGELSPADWDRQIAVDLSAVYHCVRVLLADLVERRGAVVNVASVHAVTGYPGHPAYAAAKGGVVALTRQLSAEYGASVRFNAVLPGAIQTRIWSDATPEDIAHHAGLAAVKRLGRPEEVAAAIAFLASGDASYISGACLTVDGGLTTSVF
jgi:NAD(P)-dependent dehydrogenase (short-subunit alcohol dehydrogenase family)